jgi:UDP-N-acetylglucosamine 2-epimerase
MKVVTVVGARPQFIKAAPVSRALRAAGHTEVLVHTGQHYDEAMSAIFFRDLQIPAPAYNLGVGSGSHAVQTGRILIGLEDVLLAERPDWVLAYGDTNSTLAAALAAVKLQLPLAHVESGLRSFNRTMPEEHNRVVADHCADLLFCPTPAAVTNLAHEGITQNVFLVGDTMYDAVRQFAGVARRQSTILDRLTLAPRRYLLATLHRPYNVDDPAHLRTLLLTLDALDAPVIFPVHPRTRQKIAALEDSPDRVGALRNVRLVDPVGYLDMLMLEQHARVILTDSGGMQKEAYCLGVPCVTLRPETEWTETVDAGWNVLAGTDRARIVAAVTTRVWPDYAPPIFGDGRASEAIVQLLERQPARPGRPESALAVDQMAVQV